MPPTFKELTDYFIAVGANEVSHTNKTYLAHAIGVYGDLKKWGADEDLCRVGLFHSIYGTELFQGFTLPLEKRGEVRDMIGVSAERLAYINCAMQRDSFDAIISQEQEPYVIKDRLTGGVIEMDKEEFDRLCTLHLCDWLEQVARWENWDYRRAAFTALATRLGGIAQEEFDRVFAAALPVAAED
jgi:hypothetical protein